LAYLDPDFRKQTDADKPFCCRCQKPLKDSADELTGIPVTVNWETWEVQRGHNAPMDYPNQRVIGNELIGKDCAKKIGL
jgi:hypothetical protein